MIEISPEIVSAVGGAGGAGALALWGFKTWINRITHRLDAQDIMLRNIQIALAENKGKDEGLEKLIWGKFESHIIKIGELQASDKKQWETLSKIAQPRVSDLLREALKDE